MSNQIVIDIKTVIAGGKTTLSHYIGSILREHGFDVTINDDNGIGLIEQTENKGFEKMKESMPHLAARKIPVVINTHRLK